MNVNILSTEGELGRTLGPGWGIQWCKLYVPERELIGEEWQVEPEKNQEHRQDLKGKLN